MNLPVLQLTPDEIRELKLLYLSPFGPTPGSEERPPIHPDIGIAPRYNYELYTILKGLGIKTRSCKDLNEFIKIVGAYDFVFTIYNQAPFRNSEIFVSSLCEYYNIPYLGGPPNIRALAEDKQLSKILAISLGIPVPPGIICDNIKDLKRSPDFPGPYIVKPRFGAASKHIEVDSVQETWADIVPQAAALLEAGQECLIEQCIAGTDITVPVLGGIPPLILQPAEEISELSYGIATFRQKRLLDKGRSRIILKDEGLSDILRSYAERFCREVQPFDYLRVDFRLDERREKLYLLEFNMGCNLGSHAAVVLSAKHAGISHEALINHITAYSLRRRHK